MLCPHCGHDNADGRKFCRACAKPLAPQLVPAKPPAPSVLTAAKPVPATRAPVSQPVVNRMAIASFALSFLAIIPPVGIAAVVMGHSSRRQIASSRGRQTGTGLAFAGLILSYLQLAIFALVLVGVAALWRDINQHLDRDPYVRAALIQRIKYGDPDHPSASAFAQRHLEVIDALHLIEAAQETYRSAHPDGYACDLNELTNFIANEELNLHVRQSHYDIKVLCRRGDADGYVATAFGQDTVNPAESSIYCLDQTRVIRRYRSDYYGEILAKTFYHPGSCPTDGEAVP